jgi:TrmH family RNA methyltransferase
MKIFDQVITSRNNETVKWAASLQSKKSRDASRAFLAEGEKLSLEALETGLPVSHIFVLDEKKTPILEKLFKYKNCKKFEDTVLIFLSESAFSKISTESSPQGIISVIKYLDFFKDADIIYKEDFLHFDGERVIFLSSVRDPGNLGAVIRSAAAFGIDRIILSADSADLYNPKTVRSAMGSLFRVKATCVKDTVSTVLELKKTGRRVFAAELRENAVPISEAKLNSKDVVIIGNEGHGIDPALSEASNGSVYIPISRNTESLNAAVAAAIFMWEIGK